MKIDFQYLCEKIEDLINAAFVPLLLIGILLFMLSLNMC